MPNFFYLPKQHPLTLDSLPDGRFYERDNSNIVQVHHSCAPVWCEYTGDWADGSHSWTNPISRQVHDTHPLGLKFIENNSFTDGFYEITAIEGLTFGEGEAWCPNTNSKISLEKTDPWSIWNPFFQRYDPPCHRCIERRIQYDYVNESFHKIFLDDDIMNIFYEVYCECCSCEYCSEIHIGTCENR